MTRKMRDIMSTAPVCMAPGESVSAAAKAMKQHGIGTVLVLTEGNGDLALEQDGTSALTGVSAAPPNS
jgi:CBS domain-containing protein